MYIYISQLVCFAVFVVVVVDSNEDNMVHIYLHKSYKLQN